MAEYREIFEELPDGITLHDPVDGSLLETNQQFCEMLGYTRDELLDLGFEALHVNEPPFMSEKAEQYIRNAATEGPQTFEWLNVTKAGEATPRRSASHPDHYQGQSTHPRGRPRYQRP